MTSKIAKKVCEAVNRKLGARVMCLGSEVPPVTFCPWGIPTLDMQTRGLPENRITELYGEFSSGKTTIALMCGGNWLRLHPNGLILFQDLEKTYDADYARYHGCDTSRIIVSQPFSGEEAVDTAYMFTKECNEGLHILDSVAALTSSAVLEKDADKVHVAPTARMMSGLIHKCGSSVRPLDGSPGHTILLLNQTRISIGQMYGDPTVSPGGKFKEFACSLIVYLRRGKENKTTINVSGKKYSTLQSYEVVFTVKKNKVGGRFGEKGVMHFYPKGYQDIPKFSFDCGDGLYDYGVMEKIIQKSGNAYVLELGGMTARGQKNIVKMLRDPKYQREFVDLVLAQRGVENHPASKKKKKPKVRL